MCLFPKKIFGFARDWVSYCVYGFVSWIYFLFFLDMMEIWLLDLDLGFVRD